MGYNKRRLVPLKDYDNGTVYLRTLISRVLVVAHKRCMWWSRIVFYAIQEVHFTILSSLKECIMFVFVQVAN
jgi:hypothetical protein